MTACEPCVVCEVDGLPLDPALFAERQQAARASREAVERALASIPVYVPGPLSVAVLEAPERVTAAERGRARAERIAAIPDNAPAFGQVGMVFHDRRHTRGGHRRAGKRG